MLDIAFFLYGDCYYESRKITLAKRWLKYMVRHITFNNPLMEKLSRHYASGRKTLNNAQTRKLFREKLSGKPWQGQWMFELQIL